MVAGKPVICIDRGGPALQVTKKSGIKVSSYNPKKTVSDIADAMLKLWENPGLVHQMGIESHIRAKAYFTWEKRRWWLNHVYQTISQNELFEDKSIGDL
jgi:glycosyltransferase involved in cell wall biosynthesis